MFTTKFDRLSPLFLAMIRLALCYLLILSSFWSCNDAEYASGTAEGYRLARTNCSRCHSFVPAGYLNRLTWKDYVLPNMAKRLGIDVLGQSEYINSPMNKSAIVSYKEWMAIVDYYTKTSPEVLERPLSPNTLNRSMSIFEVKKPAYKLYLPVKTVLAEFDTLSQSIFTSDGNNSNLYRWNNQLEIEDEIKLPSPAVSSSLFINMNGKEEGFFATLGHMQPTDDALGDVLRFNLSEKFGSRYDTIVTRLPRPVHIVQVDVNKDSLTDYVVCGFGHEHGGLYWMQQLPDGKFRKNNILQLPGATKTIVNDFNKDGWPDLMVLFAHDDECIRLFINNKNGSFTSKKILSFLPVNGSTSIQLADFNKDGLMDILYTCGDNADLSKIFKFYHGVYIFLNRGNDKYEQAWFYPVNGCTKAIADDFDKDGDLDIASIAFFADFRNKPEDKFLYFEQQELMKFLPYSPPIAKDGRWITMDAKDYDQDGDVDIILGNYATGFILDPYYVPDWDRRTPFIILQNKKY